MPVCARLCVESDLSVRVCVFGVPRSARRSPDENNADQPLKFNALTKCYTRGDTRLRGLLELAQTRFYPKYDFTRATCNRPQTSETEYRQRQRTRTALDADGSRSRGFNVGIRVDKQIIATVAILAKHPSLAAEIPTAELTSRKLPAPSLRQRCGGLPANA